MVCLPRPQRFRLERIRWSLLSFGRSFAFLETFGHSAYQSFFALINTIASLLLRSNLHFPAKSVCHLFSLLCWLAKLIVGCFPIGLCCERNMKKQIRLWVISCHKLIFLSCSLSRKLSFQQQQQECKNQNKWKFIRLLRYCTVACC